MKNLFLFVFSIMTINCLAQAKNDTVVSDLDFLVNKIKHSYVGYKEKIKNNDFEKLIQEVRSSTSKDTFANLSKLIMFFNDCHLNLFEQVSNKMKNADSIECQKNLPNIAAKTDNNYWVNDENTVIIYLKQKTREITEGYIVESSKNITKGFSNLTLHYNTTNEIIVDFINVDRGYRLFSKAHYKNDKVLLIGSHCRWRKITNYQTGMLQKLKPIDLAPAIYSLDSNTIVFNMKDFSVSGRKVYDSVVMANEKILAKAVTLIIDARNNAGGGYGRMFSIVPYICTKPIVTCNAYVLCSQDLIDDTKTTLEEYKKQNDTARVRWLTDYINNLIARKDSLEFNNGFTIECNTKPTNIKNVAILYNGCSRSAAELMIIYLKQSDKVKTFGEYSGGVVDNLDMLVTKLPISKHRLWVATTKRITTKDAPLYDNVGIKPDVEISDDEPDWIDFVKKYYEKK